MRKNIKKVLLFIPPASTNKNAFDINPLPPLGLAYLASVLEERNIKVKIIDCLIEGWEQREEIGDNIVRVGLNFKQIKSLIIDFAPDIVGVNNLFTKQRENAHKIYSLAKEISPDIITIAGGAHTTVMPDLVLSDPNLDYAVLGEGENTIIELVDSIEGKKDISGIDGIGYRDSNGIKIIPKTKFIDDLDSIPFPARHLLNTEGYLGLKMSHGKRRKKRFAPIITSRGCPARCTFCSAYRVWGRKFRYRSPENIIEEMTMLKEKYDIEELMFEDDNLTMDIKRAEKLFDLMIENKLNFSWDTPNGVAAYVLTEKLLSKMKKSGCYKLNLALESGNQEVLNNIIKKPLDLNKIKPLIKFARDIGLEVGIYLIMGMPGETKDQIMDSFRLAKEMKIYDPFISIATPYPGTELYDLCAEKGYLKDNFSLDDLHIRSFSISAAGWDGGELRRIMEEGGGYLRAAKYKENKYLFLKDGFIDFIDNPITFIRKIPKRLGVLAKY